MALSSAEKEIVNRPCICCGGQNDTTYLRMRFPEYPGRFEYRQCDTCGLVFNSPRLKDLSQLYRGDYFYFWKSAAFMRKRILEQIARLIRPVQPLLKGNRVLEVGSARGHFLYVLKQMGFDAHGIELSADGIASARRYLEVDTLEGTVEDLAQSHSGDPFDLVVSSCVLEHVAAPDLFVQACAKLLVDEGILVFDVPNIDSANVRKLGKAWPYFQKYHVFLFNPNSIRKLLPKCGFELVQCFSYNNGITSDRERKRMQQMRVLLVALDRLSLYRMFRRGYRGKQPQESEACDAIKSLTQEELQNIVSYAESADAQRPLAAGMQGDHLVVVARKHSM